MDGEGVIPVREQGNGAPGIGNARKQRVVLVNPPSSSAEEFGILASGGGLRPPLNLLYLAAVLRREGHEVKIVDMPAAARPFPELLAALREFVPDICGITAMTLSIAAAAATARVVKETFPGCLTLLGGAHLTAVPEETMTRFEAFDIGVLGEGEVTLMELLGALRLGTSLDRVAGLIFREGSRLRRTAARPLLDDLDTLPHPAWDLLPNFVELYRPTKIREIRFPSAYLATSRGCPFECIFCDNAVHGRRFRSFSVDYIMAMVDELVARYGVKDLVIYDENFTINGRRLVEFCSRIIARGLDLTWSCDARADTIDERKLALMYRAGCRSVSFGIESGSQRVLDFYQKKLRLDQIARAVTMTKRAGMITSGFFIIGGPTETESTILESLRFARELPLDFFTPFYFNCFPNSPAYREIRSYGEFDPDYAKANMSTPVFIPEGMTRGQLERLFNRGLRSFYLRPSKVLFLLQRLGPLFVARQGEVLLRMAARRIRSCATRN